MDSRYSASYFDVESTHWWFQARRKILKALLVDELKKRGKTRFDHALEIGCFAGKNIEEFRQLSARWSGVEPSLEAAQHAQQALPEAEILIGEFPRATPEGTYDAIFLFDVLEHIENSSAALSEIKHLLRPGGLLVITVPAYQWLWTPFDTINKHFRRYTASRLRDELYEAKLCITRIGYYNFFLFPLAVIDRILSRVRQGFVQQEIHVPSAPINAVLRFIFSIETLIVPHIFFPCGLSVITIAKNKEESV